MNRHQEIRDSLYDYVVEELEPAVRLRVEEHLQTCAACRNDLAILRDAMTVLPKPERIPLNSGHPNSGKHSPIA